MDREAGELLGDVGPLEEDDELLLDPCGVEPTFGRFGPFFEDGADARKALAKLAGLELEQLGSAQRQCAR